MSGREIVQVVPATQTKGPVRLIGTVDCDGNGTQHSLAQVDPFILLDAGTLPKDNLPPFGPHPHRGHSVVTILLKGSMKSWDSTQKPAESPPAKDTDNLEYRDVITGPASYWVDAGSGLFHKELTKIENEADPAQHVELFQLWVGVSEADRQKSPRVQIDNDLPTFECVGQTVNGEEMVVVGRGRYYVGPETTIQTPHPICVAHIVQKPGTVYEFSLGSSSHEGFVVSMNGFPKFGRSSTTPESRYDVLVLENHTNGKSSQPNDFLRVQTTSSDDGEDSEYLICTGERIGETWAKKLVVNGAIIAATPEEAREIAAELEDSCRDGPNYRAFETILQSNGIHSEAPPPASTTQSSTIPPTPPTVAQSGIDIQQALDILSSRTPHSHAPHEHDHQETGCCNQGGNISEDLKKMGQTIDMLGPAPSSPSSQEQLAQQVLHIQQQQKEKAEQHRQDLGASLKAMTKASELIRAVLRAQEDRVQTYQTYDAALQQVLSTGNLTAYPEACALATASFSVVSNTIRGVAEEMATRSNNHSLKQYIQWIKSLQALEKEKLQLTAALHLEKIRANNEQGQKRHKESDSVFGLLLQGITAMEEKIQTCVSEINEVLDELRSALADEMEEEG